MTTYDSRGDSSLQPWHRWQDWINLILGVWLVIAPSGWRSLSAMAGPASHARPDSWILGVIVIVMALWALAQPVQTAPEWINMLAGIWLFIAPWVLGFAAMAASAAWTHWIVGVVVFILAVWAASSVRHPGTFTGARPVGT